MRIFLATTLALVLLTPYVTAEKCERELVVGTPDGTYYSVDNDLCQPECIVSIWVYSDDDPDPCGPEDESDTILF